MPIINPQLQPQQPIETQPVGRRERGTGFTNIRDLLKANVGSAEKMGAAIGSSLGAKAGQLKEDVTKAGKAFQDRYQQSTEEQKKALERASGLIPSSIENIGELEGMSEKDAKSIGEKLAQAKTYKGPMGLEGADQFGGRAKSLSGMGELAKSGSYGQGLLLQNVAGKAKPYTRGQSSLDTFLLGQNKEAQKEIQKGASQTSGAEQQAKTLASGASEQAKQTAGAFSAQAADIYKKAAESGQAFQKYGKEQATQYLKDASRLKELLTNAGDVDLQTGKPLIDPASLSDYDKSLINRAGEFGVDVQNTFVDPRARYANVSKGILDAIANDTGQVVDTGGLKLNTKQMNALKNLSLLQQEAAPQLSEFKTDRFSSDKGLYGGSIQALINAQERGLADVGSQVAENVFNSRILPTRMTFDQLDKYVKASDEYRKVYEAGKGGYAQAYEKVIQDILNIFPDTTYRTPTSSFYYNPLTRAAITSARQQMTPYETEKLTQKGINVGEYLKRLYGINSQGSGQV